MKKKAPKCEYCKRPGEYRGWVFRQRKRGRTTKPKSKSWRAFRAYVDGWFTKIYQPMCEAHLLEHQFQLVPYRCVARCVKDRLRANELVMEPPDMIVYFPLAPILGGDRPKCGWCSRRLRPATIAETTRDSELD
jgi:hypothetical protein